MINLEWLRTFRAVYITKSLSRASEILMISQPTVSQQISSLESRIGQKLFHRKSKGVEETDFGRMLNTMLAGAMETLEEVEQAVVRQDSRLKNIISIGISSHLYKTILCQKILQIGEQVHIKFGNRDQLIKDVDEGRLLYAIIPERTNNFDTICHKICDQKILLVGTPEIDFTHYQQLYHSQRQQAEDWLSQYAWYAHDNNSSFIKIYWLMLFDKKRPAIVPNYIIPNEYEVLFQQSQGKGLSVAFDTTVAPFIKQGSLKYCEVKPVVYRELSLIASKQKADRQMTLDILKLLSK